MASNSKQFAGYGNGCGGGGMYCLARSVPRDKRNQKAESAVGEWVTVDGWMDGRYVQPWGIQRNEKKRAPVVSCQLSVV